MRVEQKLIDWISSVGLEDFPDAVLETTRNQLLTIVGTTVAGATEDGCLEAVDFYRQLGERERLRSSFTGEESLPMTRRS